MKMSLPTKHAKTELSQVGTSVVFDAKSVEAEADDTTSVVFEAKSEESEADDDA